MHTMKREEIKKKSRESSVGKLWEARDTSPGCGRRRAAAKAACLSPCCLISWLDGPAPRKLAGAMRLTLVKRYRLGNVVPNVSSVLSTLSSPFLRLRLHAEGAGEAAEAQKGGEATGARRMYESPSLPVLGV